MAPNAPSICDVRAQPACVGGYREHRSNWVNARPQPSIRGRREPAAAQPAAACGRGDLDCLGRRSKHPAQVCVYLPETGPQGRAYRQLN